MIDIKNLDMVDIFMEKYELYYDKNYFYSDGCFYSISDNGVVLKVDNLYGENKCRDESFWVKVMECGLKPVDLPRKGDKVYLSMINKVKEPKCISRVWIGDTWDIEMYRRGLIHNSEEDATRLADEIIRFTERRF